MLMMILVALVGFFVFRFLNDTAERYTATAPRDLPKVAMPADELKALEDRVEAFRKAVEMGTPIEPLVLTSDDINALIEDSPELKGKIFVKIEGKKLKGQVSIPLDALANVPFLGMFKGRYLNGEADLKASLQDGVLIVTLDSIEVNGQSPPEQMMTTLRQQNLAKDARTRTRRPLSCSASSRASKSTMGRSSLRFEPRRVLRRLAGRREGPSGRSFWPVTQRAQGPVAQGSTGRAKGRIATPFGRGACPEVLKRKSCNGI